MPGHAVLWFRNDLRLTDHAALDAAVASGCSILPVYVLDTSGDWAPGGASRWWLHHSLAALREALASRGAPLVLRRGSAAEEVPKIAREVGASGVYTGAGVEPASRQADRKVATALERDGIELHRCRTTLLFPPEKILTRGGTPFGVFTPFSRACLDMPEPPPPRSAPDKLGAAKPPKSDRLEAWDLLPRRPDWAGGLRDTWTPGEAGAAQRLAEFCKHALRTYETKRDRPDLPGTSMLSPHLHFGELSPSQVWHAVHSGQGHAAFRRELLWREFNQYLLWHRPEMPDQPLRAEFANMPWRKDAAALHAWQRGLTGVPIVDAGMRQLWHCGWMHNRVRMIVGSYLVKHLLLPWQEGERWFWDTLVDADLGNNAGNWQWVAGSGADAAPYFRVFNPVLQGRKFDPDGAYVREFIPELAQLDTKWIHLPEEAPASALQEARIELGKTYPVPLVDLADGRRRALAAFEALRRT
jgi:deoxyribodipyrimidine photo-lyase